MILLFVLMSDTNNDEDQPITFLDIKANLMNYSLSKLKYPFFVLIDSVNELIKDK